ncbi:MAG: hypothetical protein R2685_10480 [Candidatus Nitrosocosmicus sp.]|nr:hypothetical protein [Candidatus Nitrosocosmicus sp.]
MTTNEQTFNAIEEVLAEGFNDITNIQFDMEKEISDQVEKKVFEVIKERIHKGDPQALSILITAKEKVKNSLDWKAIKYTLIALKPFYLTYIILLMSQRPDSI